jgi:hypothetical protein
MNFGGKGKLVFGVFAFVLSSLVAILFIFPWIFFGVFSLYYHFLCGLFDEHAPYGINGLLLNKRWFE